MAHEVHAVLTGDIIESSNLNAAELETAMAVLGDAATVLSHSEGSDLRFTRFRGDGWQVCLVSPGLCLTASLYFAARLKAEAPNAETRIATGLGTVDHLPEGTLEGARGDAFANSGHRLDDMGRGDRLAILGTRAGAGGLVTPFHQAIYALAGRETRGWTQGQAQAVAEALGRGADDTQQDIAERLGVTRQSVQKRLAAAGYPELREALLAFQTHDWNGR